MASWAAWLSVLRSSMQAKRRPSLLGPRSRSNSNNIGDAYCSTARSLTVPIARFEEGDQRSDVRRFEAAGERWHVVAAVQNAQGHLLFRQAIRNRRQVGAAPSPVPATAWQYSQPLSWNSTAPCKTSARVECTCIGLSC